MLYMNEMKDVQRALVRAADKLQGCYDWTEYCSFCNRTISYDRKHRSTCALNREVNTLLRLASMMQIRIDKARGTKGV